MTPKNVLVVDDSKSEQRLIAALLGQLGLTVTLANCADEAMTQIAQQVPDLVVLDVVMPGLNGFELCRKIRANAATEKVPVILCSSKDQEFDRFWGLRQGATGYITKPFAPQELISTVQEHLAAV
jgi:twitching motility two-component system response regulator PilH